jgi:hypothetical protein
VPFDDVYPCLYDPVEKVAQHGSLDEPGIGAPRIEIGLHKA